MNILENNNLKKIAISLIVVFAVIFIIVGERPRHKTDVKNHVNVQKPTVQKALDIQEAKSHKPIAVNNVEQAPTPTIQPQNIQPTAEEPKNEHEKLLSSINGKKIIEKNYSNNTDLMEKAIEDHNKKLSKKSATYSEKDNTDKEQTQTGIVNTEGTLEVSKDDQAKIQAEEGKKGEPLGGITDISDSEPKEKAIVNPAIQEERNLQQKYPQRYSTSTVVGTGIVYAIDTSTAQVKVLLEGDSFWTSLGKPEEAEKSAIQNYILEGETKNSAVILDISSAQAWRVTFSGDDITWSKVKPFADSE